MQSGLLGGHDRKSEDTPVQHLQNAHHHLQALAGLHDWRDQLQADDTAVASVAHRLQLVLVQRGVLREEPPRVALVHRHVLVGREGHVHPELVADVLGYQLVEGRARGITRCRVEVFSLVADFSQSNGDLVELAEGANLLHVSVVHDVTNGVDVVAVDAHHAVLGEDAEQGHEFVDASLLLHPVPHGVRGLALLATHLLILISQTVTQDLVVVLDFGVSDAKRREEVDHVGPIDVAELLDVVLGLARVHCFETGGQVLTNEILGTGQEELGLDAESRVRVRQSPLEDLLTNLGAFEQLHGNSS